MFQNLQIFESCISIFPYILFITYFVYKIKGHLENDDASRTFFYNDDNQPKKYVLLYNKQIQNEDRTMLLLVLLCYNVKTENGQGLGS